MKKQFIILSALLLSALYARAEISTKEITYSDGTTDLKGYVAVDESIDSKRPGVIVVHEWWGHNPYARKRAEMLAKEGYIAFALDMYGEGKTAEHPSDAGDFASKISQNAPLARKRFEAALDELKQHPQVNPEKIAAIGYCFGGSTVLDMARMGVDLDGVASVHGGLDTQIEAELGDVKAKILVCHGGSDPFIPEEKVRAFRIEMDALGADYTIEIYPEATHSFSNPDATAMGEKFDLPLRYSEEADKQSWEDILAFLNDIF